LLPQVAEDNADETLKYLKQALETVNQRLDSSRRADAEVLASIRAKTEAKINAAVAGSSSSSPAGAGSNGGGSSADKRK
jgi:hypothetical protein